MGKNHVARRQLNRGEHELRNEKLSEGVDGKCRVVSLDGDSKHCSSMRKCHDDRVKDDVPDKGGMRTAHA
jgi:hypothetical protein